MVNMKRFDAAFKSLARAIWDRMDAEKRENAAKKELSTLFDADPAVRDALRKKAHLYRYIISLMGPE